MTFRSPGFGGRVTVGRSRLLVPVIVILVIVVVVFLAFTAIWTDVLWYRSVGFSSVYTKQITTRVLLFFSAGLIMVVLLGANIVLAYRLRPAYRPSSAEQQGLDRYRTVVDPHRRIIVIAILSLIGLLTASAAAGRWRTWLAVPQPPAVRRQGPAVPQGHLVLRVHLPATAGGARLPVHRGDPDVHRLARRALPVRRGACAGRGGEGQPRRPRAPVRAVRRVRAAQGRGVLVRPLGPRRTPNAAW